METTHGGRFMRSFLLALFCGVLLVVPAFAQAPPSCEVQLNGTKFTLGGEMQQHAIVVEKLRESEAKVAELTKKIADLEKQAAAKKPEPAK
jgi:hypothetical protein